MGLSILDIQNAEYIILKKEDLMNLLVEANLRSAVDMRVKWIDKKTACTKHGVTRHWLDTASNDPFSLLRVQSGKGITSPKKYNEQSIIDEQNRLAD